MTYYIRVIGLNLVRIDEDVVSYPMTKEQAEESLEVVKANRAKYADDDCYLRRLNFYEDVLNAFNGTASRGEQ